MALNLINKITARDLGFDKPTIQELVFGNKETLIPLFRVIGVMTDKKSYVDSNSGDVGFGLKGQFEATNIHNGETFGAAVCYLPSMAANMVIAAFDMAKEEDPKANVRMAFDVFAKYDAKAATSYVFGVTPLTDPNRIDALAELRTQAGDLPALPAPTAAVSEADKAAAAATEAAADAGKEKPAKK